MSSPPVLWHWYYIVDSPKTERRIVACNECARRPLHGKSCDSVPHRVDNTHPFCRRPWLDFFGSKRLLWKGRQFGTRCAASIFRLAEITEAMPSSMLASAFSQHCIFSLQPIWRGISADWRVAIRKPLELWV